MDVDIILVMGIKIELFFVVVEIGDVCFGFDNWFIGILDYQWCRKFCICSDVYIFGEDFNFVQEVF